MTFLKSHRFLNSGSSKTTAKSLVLLAGAISLILMSPGVRAADEAATTPATTPAIKRASTPATKPDARDIQALNKDIDQQFGDIKDLLADPRSLCDADFRAKIAPKVLPLYRKLADDFDEILPMSPVQSRPRIDLSREECLMMMSLLGDGAATDQLQTQVESLDQEEMLRGKLAQTMVSWWRDARDKSAAVKIVDQVEALAKDNPESQELTLQMFEMSKVASPPQDQADRLVALIGTMRNSLADNIQQSMAGEKKLATALEGKPLVITGKQPDGKAFTTADFKGKVVLVDFWATWCGPCMEEMPRVKQMYATYHAKGLEVLGVSNDFSAKALEKFMEANHDSAPWPQLFDTEAAQNQGWNPITTGFGIEGIPTMFLIDKKGVLRSVTAREKMEDLIPQLLAE